MYDIQLEKYNNHRIATAFHDAGAKNIVIFCHGFRSKNTGPNRFFVWAAERLKQVGISSLRFDQYGCGNSEGDFFDSSFNDWIATTKAIVRDYLSKGYNVVLFGQSMGGATVITAGSELPSITAVVAWVPDPNVGEFQYPEAGYMEEGGQRVQAAYWQEAHEAGVVDKLASMKAPAYIVQCTDDEYVDNVNRQAIIDNAQPHHQVDNFEGYAHSRWTYEQAEDIINKSVGFIEEAFDGQKVSG